MFFSKKYINEECRKWTELAEKSSLSNPYEYLIPQKVKDRTKTELVEKGFYVSTFDVNIDNLEMKLKDFLVSSIDGDKLEMLDEHVDCLWHNFILDTESYISFCFANFGKMIHHVPHSTKNELTDDEVAFQAAKMNRKIHEFTKTRNITYDNSHYTECDNSLLFYIVIASLMDSSDKSYDTYQDVSNNITNMESDLSSNSNLGTSSCSSTSSCGSASSCSSSSSSCSSGSSSSCGSSSCGSGS